MKKAICVTTLGMWSNGIIDFGRLLFLVVIVHFKLHVYILQRIVFASDPKVSCPQNGNKLWHQLGGQQTRINGGGEVLTDSCKPVECDQALP